MTGQTKYVVVTGASSGIGREVAKAFATRGKNLVIVARRRKELEELRTEILTQYPSLDVVIKDVDLSGNAHELYSSLAGLPLEAWINNAGFGHYGSVAHQDLGKIESMLRLNVEALTILSTLFVRDYRDVPGTQLINVSSAGGYTIVPNAVTYCATKFYVSAFTEGLALELKASGARLRAKVIAPAATETGFGRVANGMEEYDYDKAFGTYHTSRQMAGLVMDLYDSDKVVGAVNRETFCFELFDPQFPYAGDSAHNQKC